MIHITYFCQGQLFLIVQWKVVFKAVGETVMLCLHECQLALVVLAGTHLQD